MTVWKKVCQFLHRDQHQIPFGVENRHLVHSFGFGRVSVSGAASGVCNGVQLAECV